MVGPPGAGERPARVCRVAAYAGSRGPVASHGRCSCSGVRHARDGLRLRARSSAPAARRRPSPSASVSTASVPPSSSPARRAAACPAGTCAGEPSPERPCARSARRSPCAHVERAGTSSDRAVEVIDAQYGGLLADSASVLVVTRSWRRSGDRLVPGGRTFDVRLSRRGRALAGRRGPPVATRATGGRPSPRRPARARQRPHRPAAGRAAGRGVGQRPRQRADRDARRVAAPTGSGSASLRSGHPLHVFGTTRLSDHPQGRAFDTWRIDGHAVVDARTSRGAGHRLHARGGRGRVLQRRRALPARRRRRSGSATTPTTTTCTRASPPERARVSCDLLPGHVGCVSVGEHAPHAATEDGLPQHAGLLAPSGRLAAGPSSTRTAQRITDPEEVERIKSLVIPPAWQDVWISPYPNGHIQAVGTDDAGRRQYLYHPDWRIKRDAMKFDRVLEAAPRAAGRARAIARDLALEGMPLERAGAVAVRLLDLGYFRIGSDVYADDQRLLRADHPRAAARRASSGPAGLPLRRQVRDRAQHRDRRPRRARRRWTSLRRRRGGSDQRLLAYQDRAALARPGLVLGQQPTSAGLLGGDLTAKDFRTWHATVLAAAALAASDEPG